MTQTRIREVKLGCIRCGNTFLSIKNCLIPIHFGSIFLICPNCSYVIKGKDDFQMESLESDLIDGNQPILKRELYDPEKYI